MAKYDPLKWYLGGRLDARVVLDFERMEKILGFALPRSAHFYPAWWSNEVGGRHVQAHAWMEAGWHVDGIDLAKRHVVFAKRGG
ncbi:hypothetical protein KHC23_09080 [Ancylobacter dichloromethanicus]|uniref:DUF7662 domain-containing protein n=1 Tax=Ancylobacter dichloromethanicus TaxID=518825 RepID=A0A9W6J7Y5_9HYPH|nr:hypothetical protein [Ancylobacter dichloromethanicus]MBS7553804.1 hypothetical protein [Ancylobacter dichloromethanicus]GLK70910.1 hypothetical protein GCM10017643_10250 [Ancylobacter dichloromethanicus]